MSKKLRELETKRDALDNEIATLTNQGNEIVAKADATDDEQTEFRSIGGKLTELREQRVTFSGLIVAERDASGAKLDELQNRNPGLPAMDAETRERVELRGKFSLTRAFQAAVAGRGFTGPEAELQAAGGFEGAQIPLEVFEPMPRADTEIRAVSEAPGTTGINLMPIQPFVFSESVAPKLMIDMPQVESGSFAHGTISQAVTADAVAKSALVPQTAAVITVQTTTPHRIGASVGFAAEDIAAVGQDNFESILRQNTSMSLSDQLDDMMLNGDIVTEANELEGIFKRLTDPVVPAATAETWERFVAIQATGIEGLWASMLSHIGMLVGPETYRLMASTVRSGNAADQTALEHLTRVGVAGMGVWTNKRMPAKDSHVQQGILCRKGRPGLRTAVCPTWGYLGIDDIYTGSRKGERYLTLSVLVGDVIVVQSDAYKQVAFRVSV